MRRLFSAIAIAMTFLIVPAQAQTIGYADAIDILSQSCGEDIQRHCSTATLANFGIGDCLRRSAISNSCSTALTRVTASLQARQEAQANAERICATDVRRLCPMTEAGRGRILRCLLKASPSASAACNTAITNAGWR